MYTLKIFLLALLVQTMVAHLFKGTILHSLKQLILAIHQLITCIVIVIIFNQKAYADMTFSAHSHMWRCEGKILWSAKFVDWLFYTVFKQEDHCYQAFLSELNGKHLPDNLRDTIYQ